MRTLLMSLALFGLCTPAIAADGESTAVADRSPNAKKKGKKAKNGTKGKKGKKGKKVRIDEVSPVHGVLLYGPKLGTHDKYEKRTKGKKSAVVKKKDLPVREVSRGESFAVGLTAGTMMHGTTEDERFSDLGLGIKGRYRPVEFAGIELGVARHGSSLLGGERGQTLFSASGEVFAFPWSKLSPYALVGVTLNQRGPDTAALTGAHGGVGIEYTVQNNIALDLEGRMTGWLNRDEADTTSPLATSITAGVVFHF